MGYELVLMTDVMKHSGRFATQIDVSARRVGIALLITIGLAFASSYQPTRLISVHRYFTLYQSLIFSYLHPKAHSTRE